MLLIYLVISFGILQRSSLGSCVLILLINANFVTFYFLFFIAQSTLMQYHLLKLSLFLLSISSAFKRVYSNQPISLNVAGPIRTFRRRLGRLCRLRK